MTNATNKEVKQLSPLSTSILTAVLAAATAEAPEVLTSKGVAEVLNIKPSSVSGALANLTKNKMVSVDEDGNLKVLRGGKAALGVLKREPKADTKIAKAKELFGNLPGAARKDVMAAMVANIGISTACAATYYATAKKAAAATA